jgi:predicted metal-binding membrane protein
LGVAVSAIEMRYPLLARATPTIVGAVVLIAGALQFTSWKARRLACRLEMRGRGHMFRGDVGGAWRHGLHLGVHCANCCATLMVIPLVIGLMDLRVMALVAAAITAERLAPAGRRVTRVIGVVVVGAGVFMIARAGGLG